MVDSVFIFSQLEAFIAAIGVFAGLLGIWFTARQMRIQAKAQMLTSVLETNNLWRDAVALIDSPVSISATTLGEVRKIYSKHNWSFSTVLPQGHDFLVPILKGPPYLLLAFLPGASASYKPPQTEDEYRAEMMTRAIAFSVVMNGLSARRDVESSDAKARHNASASIHKDLRDFVEALDKYVKRMNEVAELFEHGLTPRKLFMDKRHVAIIQQSFTIEPYILWKNTQSEDRWGLRVLSLGESARSYHWRSPLHRKPVAIKNNPEGYESRGNYPGLVEQFGFIVAEGPTRNSIASSWIFHSKNSPIDGFKFRDKKLQNQLCEGLSATSTLFLDRPSQVKPTSLD